VGLNEHNDEDNKVNEIKGHENIKEG